MSLYEYGLSIKGKLAVLTLAFTVIVSSGMKHAKTLMVI